MSAERDAFSRLELASQLAEGELYSPSQAKASAYSARLKAYLKTVGLPTGEASTNGSKPPRPTREDVAASIRKATIDDGKTGAELIILVQQLAEASGLHPAAVQQLAAEVERERTAADRIAAEVRAIHAEADRLEIQSALTLQAMLPARVADAIEARTRYLTVTGPSAVVPFLAGIAGLAKLGTQVVGSASSGLIVPINLYAALVGASGVMKTPAGTLLISANYSPLEAELAAGYKRQVEDWKAECREIKKGGEKPDPPQRPSIITSDTTGEALTATLQENESRGLGMMLYRDELAGLFGSLNAYRGGKGGDEQQLLELFDGRGMKSLRVSGTRYYSRAQFSIYGTIQPDVLNQLVAGGDASGLWARFLFVPVPAKAVMLPEIDDDREALAAAAELEQISRTVYAMAARPYRLSPDAAARFRAYHYSRQQAVLGAALGAHGALYGKSSAKVLRVAGALHLVAIAAGEAPSTGPIGDDVLERAILLVDNLDAYALGIHSAAAGDGPSGLMRTVQRVAEAAAIPVTANDISKRLSGKQRKEAGTAGILAAMQALTAAGYGEIETGSRGATRYRATETLP
ncbi:DUF3987 domain-containing protein [Synechococcus sp. EJ6-Ellesmere]|uniref:DUF3987 domain-containing protein n=1 Tax=Synechococcus sp. EJ6-Ellesmere TaxID=2823734 RepID=UPI0020CE685B|nr:DUF3987 domain-containing protein [Synechococcus sp. EJ6-Ellesmere]MCP9824506.1 DUF3987 domain-containing protein [Synechococcus sp. EJ6-Ellesmere]